MFLATTGLVELWDTRDEIIVLGSWGLREDQRENWKTLKVTRASSPWSDNRAIAKAAGYCCEATEGLEESLGLFLNQTHGTSHGKRYWKTLLGGWLLYYVHAFYDRYTALKRAFDNYENLKAVVLDPACYETPLDTVDFLRLAYGPAQDQFNLQMYSQALRAMGLKEAIWKQVALSHPHKRPKQEVRAIKRLVQCLSPWFTRTTRPEIMMGTGFKHAQLLRLVTLMAPQGGVQPGPRPVFQEPRALDQSLREQIGNIPSRDEFTSALVKSLRFNFPVIWLEGYADFRDSCLKIWPHRPKIIVSGNDWYGNEPFKLLAAEFQERGSRLWGLQSGAGYGMSAVIPQEEFESSIVDRWISYGWSDLQGTAAVESLPHPRFPSLRKKNGQRLKNARGILLVTTNHPQYHHRFESGVLGKFGEIIDWRDRFIQALPDTHRRRLAIKLKDDHDPWEQKKRLREAHGPLRIEGTKKSFHRLLAESRIAVIEYYGTTMLEALAADIPTVLFWDPQTWQFRESAQPYIEKLREAGILHETPEAAAHHVLQVYEVPSHWWDSKLVQTARKAFVERYALGNKNWAGDWVKAFRKELSCIHREQAAA